MDVVPRARVVALCGDETPACSVGSVQHWPETPTGNHWWLWRRAGAWAKLLATAGPHSDDERTMQDASGEPARRLLGMITDNAEVLLVEDNPYDAELTVMSLRRSGLAERVFHVKDGVEASDYIFATGRFGDRDGDALPRLVLLDIKLPRVDGVEVLRRMKSDERTAGVPVVALTSSREEQDIAACYRLGVNSYVVKPVDFDQFSRVITRVAAYWLRLNKPPY